MRKRKFIRWADDKFLTLVGMKHNKGAAPCGKYRASVGVKIFGPLSGRYSVVGVRRRGAAEAKS